MDFGIFMEFEPVDTEKGALEEARESITYYFSRQSDLTKNAVGREGAGPAERQQARVDQLAALGYAEILDNRVAFGSAAGLVDRLTALRERLGIDGIAAELNPGGMLTPEQSEAHAPDPDPGGHAALQVGRRRPCGRNGPERRLSRRPPLRGSHLRCLSPKRT
jgi:hypothetical protein